MHILLIPELPSFNGFEFYLILTFFFLRHKTIFSTAEITIIIIRAHKTFAIAVDLEKTL
jgi:hypothetical protein